MISVTAVAITQLVVYIIFLPFILYLLYAHGIRGLLGYLYLLIFCVLQLISGGLQISNPNNTTATILASVGLSPLLLGLASIVHETHQHFLVPNSEKAKLGWVFQLLLHIGTFAALALVAIGGSRLSKDHDGSEYHHDVKLREAGSILFLVVFLAIIAHASWVFLNHRSSTCTMAKRLLYSALVTLPFIFSRIFYTIVYSFAIPGSHTFYTLSPATAPIAIRVIFLLLLLLLATLSLVVGGLLSRHLVRFSQALEPQGFENHETQEPQPFDNYQVQELESLD